jgi:hypothetical protein
MLVNYRYEAAIHVGNVDILLPDVEVLDVKGESGRGLRYLHLDVHGPFKAEVVGDDEGDEVEGVPHRYHAFRQSGEVNRR